MKSRGETNGEAETHRACSSSIIEIKAAAAKSEKSAPGGSEEDQRNRGAIGNGIKIGGRDMAAARDEKCRMFGNNRENASAKSNACRIRQRRLSAAAPRVAGGVAWCGDGNGWRQLRLLLIGSSGSEKSKKSMA